MLYKLLRQYFESDKLPWYTPLDVDVLTVNDYHLYLYDGGSIGWFVVVETDYVSTEDIPRDIETSFPVKVEGWRTLLKYQKKTGEKLLARDVFKNESVDESDEDWEHYQGIVYQDGLKYALLKVEPEQGVSVKDFNLTYYRT